MRDLIELRQYWRSHAASELALATLIRKQGSTYRAIGAKKIIVRTAGSCGLLSGGCLEADIDDSARQQWEQLPFIKSFSTMHPEDRLLGYQNGCAGVIDILFEKLPVDATQMDLFIPFGEPASAAGVIVALHPASLGERQFSTTIPASDANFYFDCWQHPVQLFIIGCGLDALPFYKFAEPLGWDIHFLDYRESLKTNLPAQAQATILPLPKLARCVRAGTRSAIVIMTHNFQADLQVLQDFAARAETGEQFGYIGCLGPRARFEQMLQELAAPLSAALQSRIHAPAGLFSGTHSPEAIALSIIAEIESQLGTV